MARWPESWKCSKTVDTQVRLQDLGKRVAVFAIPGAFTPTCSAKHLPGFVAQKDRIKAAGVDAIVCVSVNDPFVMKAYGKQAAPAEAESKEIRFLADTSGELGRRLGMLFDATAALGGERWRRANLLVEDGVIKYVEAETGGAYTKTGATQFLHDALGDSEAPTTEFDPVVVAP